MDRIWPTITNADALAINDAWAGLPGTLVKTYPSTHPEAPFMLDQGVCDGSKHSIGWQLDDNGKLHTPTPARPFDGSNMDEFRRHISSSSSSDATIDDGLCLDGNAKSGPAGQSTSGLVSCPPPTTKCGASPCPGCGSLLTSCSNATGVWTHDATTGLLQWNLTSTDSTSSSSSDGPWPTEFGRRAPPKAKCLSARPSSSVGGFYGGPRASLTMVKNCPSGKGKVPNTSTFTLTAKGELQAGTGLCIVAKPMYAAQLWSKPLPNHRVAVLIVNIGELTTDVELNLQDVPDLPCAGGMSGSSSSSSSSEEAGGTSTAEGGGGCKVRDVWAAKDLAPGSQQLKIEQLRSHQSQFYILG
eukprot:COSAG06_NODE_4120_length_4550_cov_1.804314_4_plen_356_part_00